MDLAKELNVDISVQPVFEHLWGHPGEMYEKRLGDRYKETNQFKRYLEKGLRLIGGSDSDVTELNPLLGIHTEVNHPKTTSSISVYEAVRMFTYNSQFSVSKEDVKGTLEIDKIADFVVLDQDLFDIESLAIKETNVLKTYKDGKCIYSRGDQFE
jgi:predicted amidohydrolase YtcJ